MRALNSTRVAVVMGAMAASLLMAGGAQASTAGDKDDRYEGKSSGSYTEYEEREEFVSERSGHSEKKMRDYWEERDRDDHWSPRWHYANPRHGDFDFRDGDDHHDHGRHHHRHDRVRAGDGGDGGR